MDIRKIKKLIELVEESGIWLIGKNTNGIVRLLGFDPQQTESEVSDDELRVSTTVLPPSDAT